MLDIEVKSLKSLNHYLQKLVEIDFGSRLSLLCIPGLELDC